MILLWPNKSVTPVTQDHYYNVINAAQDYVITYNAMVYHITREM